MRRRRHGRSNEEERTEADGELSAGMRLGDQRKRGGRRVDRVCSAVCAGGSGWRRKQRGDCNMREERRGTINSMRETEIIEGEREKEQRG